MDGWMGDGCLDGWMDRPLDGCMGERMEGVMDYGGRKGGMDG